MEYKIFYSWQSDLPNKTNRGFIETALKKAIKNIKKDDSLEIEPVIDRDTVNVAGSPDIDKTIFSKIEQAEIFVCDVSIINQGSETRLTPNPNVLIELGYAMKMLGNERILMVMNTAYGNPENLPFDLRIKRVISYNVSENDPDKATERNKLTRILESHIRTILNYPRLTQPILNLQFGNYETQEKFGQFIKLNSVVYDEDEDTENTVSDSNNNPYPSWVYEDTKEEKTKKELLNARQEFYRGYWQELEEYCKFDSRFKLVQFVLNNLSEIKAENISININITNVNNSIAIISCQDNTPIPEKPISNDNNSLYRAAIENDVNNQFRLLEHIVSNQERSINIESFNNNKEWKATINIGDIKPKATVWTECFYIGSLESGKFPLDITLYGDNLSEPQKCQLEIEFEVEKQHPLTIDMLREMYQVNEDII